MLTPQYLADMLNEFFLLNYPKTKLLILALLGVNIFIYALTDSLLSSIDALGWLGLLILYELEAETDLKLLNLRREKLQNLRNALISLVVMVFFSYLYNKAWLDVTNGLLWFALIAMIELEIRRPDQVLKHQSLYWLINLCVFLGLLLMVAVWLWEANWLDAYDAMLWIVAFAFIEVDIFHFLRPRGT